MKVTITTQDATGLIEEQSFTNLTPTYVMEVISHPYLVKAVIEKEGENNTMKDKEILQEAINKFGVKNQLDMAIEECAELIQAINKVRRAGLVSDVITKPIMSVSIGDTIAYSNLCAEVADVKIMIAQLELMLDKDTIQKAYDTKIKRLSTIV